MIALAENKKNPVKRIVPFRFVRKKKPTGATGVRPGCHTRASGYSKNDRVPEVER